MVASVQTILDTPHRQIRAYRAMNPGEAGTLFASDARQMAADEWHIQSQVWASEGISPPRRFVRGMFVGSGGGTLTVTYTK